MCQYTNPYKHTNTFLCSGAFGRGLCMCGCVLCTGMKACAYVQENIHACTNILIQIVHMYSCDKCIYACACTCSHVLSIHKISISSPEAVSVAAVGPLSPLGKKFSNLQIVSNNGARIRLKLIRTVRQCLQHPAPGQIGGVRV